jgi:hypothetical protein
VFISTLCQECSFDLQVAGMESPSEEGRVPFECSLEGARAAVDGPVVPHDLTSSAAPN